MKTHTLFSHLALLIVTLAISSFSVTSCIDDTGSYNRGQSGYYLPTSQQHVSDRYTYYPNQQVYYDNRSRQYTWQQDNRWLTQSRPPHGFYDNSRSSPSVRMNFNDEPSRHHHAVTQQYPRHWKDQKAPPNKDDKKRYQPYRQ